MTNTTKQLTADELREALADVDVSPFKLLVAEHPSGAGALLIYLLDDEVYPPKSMAVSLHLKGSPPSFEILKARIRVGYEKFLEEKENNYGRTE